MKRLPLLIILASLMMTSCLKDGLHDFDALKNPISVEGTVNPTLGVPIAYGSLSLFDVINMIQQTVADLEVDDNGIISIVYDTTQHWNVPFESGKGSGLMNSSDIVHVARKEIKGVVAIDLFNQISELDNAEMEVDSLKVNLNAFIKADAHDSTLQRMNEYHVHVYYASLFLDVKGKDNSHKIFYIGDSITIDSLIQGQNIVLFDNTDISDAINKRPVEITYGARMNIAFEAAFFGTGLSEDDFVSDSLGVNAVDIDANIKVSFPISTYINNLGYETDISFSSSFDPQELSIDSSALYIECDNSIPLALQLRCQLKDESDIVLGDLLNPIVTTLAAPGSKKTTIEIPVTRDIFDKLQKTKKIHLNAMLNTADLNPPARVKVAVRATDKLDLRIYAKVQPSYNFSFNLTGGNTEEGGSK